MAAQHRPGWGGGKARAQLFRAGVQRGSARGVEALFGGGAQRVVVHVGRPSQPPERIGGVAGDGGGRDLGAVARQRFTEHVHRGVGVGGFRREHPVRVGFGGG